MRWTIYVCPHCDSDWGPTERHHPMHCWACNKDIPGRELREVKVMPVSFTDEDVERVALAISVRFAAWPLRSRGVTRYTLSPDGAEELARAALSAYLEPTTKGDT